MESYNATTKDSILTPNLSSQFALLATLIILAIYTLSSVYVTPTRTDKKGNHIPSGPIGLPIVGKTR